MPVHSLITAATRRAFISTIEPLEGRIAPAALTVTNLSDHDVGSLRDVLAHAVDGDSITLPQGTILLASPLTITAGVTISGAAANLSIINGGENGVVLDIESASGQVSLMGLTVLGGFAGSETPGGGIIAHNSSLSLTGVEVRGNVALGAGSGISFVDSVGNHSLTITSSTIAENEARNDGQLAGSVLGGGIYFDGAGDTLFISNSTVSGNTAVDSGGGIGIVAAAKATIHNSTIFGNAAGGTGGGVYLGDGEIVLQSASSIYYGNTAGVTGNDVGGTGFLNSSHDLVDSTGIEAGASFTFPVLEDPKLGPLRDNGGGVRTHALAGDSPALNKGSNPDELLFDARGTGFPRSTQGAVDIGAFQHMVGPDLKVTITDGLTTVNPGDTVEYTVTVANNGLAAASNFHVTIPASVGSLVTTGGDFTQEGNSYVYTGDSLEVGGSVTLHFSVQVPATVHATDQLTFTATVTDDGTNGPEIFADDNSATDSDTIDASSNLSFFVTSSVPEGQEVAHGGFITYTLHYANTGTRDSGPLALDETVPAHTHFVPELSDLWTSTGNPVEAYTGSYKRTVTVDAGASGTSTFTVQVDPDTPTSVTSVTNTASLENGILSTDDGLPLTDTVGDAIYSGIIVTAPGVSVKGHYAEPLITVGHIGTERTDSFLAYGGDVRDNVRIAVGDFDGDGYDDIAVSTQHGKAPMAIYDAEGNDLESPLAGLRPLGKHDGGYLAAGHFSLAVDKFTLQIAEPLITPDNLIVGSSLGGGAVKVLSGVTGQQLGETLYPFGKSYHGGVRVAVGDVNGDGVDDLITGQGEGGSTVKIYSGVGEHALLAKFKAGSARAGGVSVATGDFDGDGVAELLVGRNGSAKSSASVYTVDAERATAVKIADLTAFNLPSSGGVKVAVTDINHDGIPDLVVAAGFKGQSRVRVFSGDAFQQRPELELVTALTPPPMLTTDDFDVISSFSAYENPLPGVFVAGTATVPSLPAYVHLPPVQGL